MPNPATFDDTMSTSTDQKASAKIHRQDMIRVQIDTPALLNLSKHCKDNKGKSVQGTLMGIFKGDDQVLMIT
jgi:hypothetical protein